MHQKIDHIAQPLSLRHRLILALMTPLLIILTAASIFDYQLAKKTANRAHDQALAESVFDLAEHLKRQSPDVKIDLEEESEAMLRSNAPDVLFFSVLDTNGKVLAGDNDLPQLPQPSGERIEYFDKTYHEKIVRMATYGLTTRTQYFQIVVAETTEKRNQASSQILTAMIIPNLAVIIATLLAVIFGVRQGLLPLNAVERDIAGRSGADLHEIDVAGTPTEIRPMLARLNELFAQVRKSIDIQQRFIGDAAHQLRTPLAGLQNQLDVANAEGTFDKKPERFHAIEEATTRLSHLLNQLLTYARTEILSALKDGGDIVELGQLVEDSASLFLDAALAKSIDLGFDINPAQTTGSSWMLQEALSNLIDNAIRYSPTGSIVTVRCGTHQGQAFLRVEDSGAGISEEHLKHVFERFYRVPGSPGHGCGLGLAIVQEIAELHGAQIEFPKTQAGFCVQIIFQTK